MSAEALCKAWASWARGQDDVLACALAGSHARGTARPDSDIDMVVILQDPQARLHDLAWIAQIAPHSLPQREDWGLVQALRMQMMGCELELGLTCATWMTPPIDGKTAAVMRDGLRVIWDPDGWLQAGLSWALAQE